MSLKLRQNFRRQDPPGVPRQGAWAFARPRDRDSTTGKPTAQPPSERHFPHARRILGFFSDQWIGRHGRASSGADRRLILALQPNRR